MTTMRKIKLKRLKEKYNVKYQEVFLQQETYFINDVN